MDDNLSTPTESPLQRLTKLKPPAIVCDNDIHQITEGTQMDDSVQLYEHLSSRSEKDARFEQHKARSVQMSMLYQTDTEDGYQGFLSGDRAVMFERYGYKLNHCGEWLKFMLGRDGLKLADARFCKVPLCPTCSWRRALKWRAKALEILPLIQESHPTARWLFVTLTIKNCDLQHLRESIRHLNASFNRLSKQSRFPFIGLVKSVEVTRAWDCFDAFSGDFLGRHGTKWVDEQKFKHGKVLRLEQTTEVHPHLHIVGIVPSGYFDGKNYINQKEWTENWKNALRVEYTPIVNVKAVKCRKNLKLEDLSDEDLNKKNLINAICETIKYTVKEADLIGGLVPFDLIDNSRWLKRMTEQIYKTRKVEYRGVFKEYAKQLEITDDDDLININEEEKVSQEESIEITYGWSSVLEKYICTYYT
jgi:plasmid rolling circle replication initiator protein Rep